MGSACEALPAEQWTVDDAAQFLDPPIPRRQLAMLITVLRVKPIGTRRRPQGRPAFTYDPAELQRLHSGVAEWLTRPGNPKT